MTCRVPAVNLIYYMGRKDPHRFQKQVDTKKACFTSKDVFFSGCISLTISKVNVPPGGDRSVKWRESNRYSPSYEEKQRVILRKPYKTNTLAHLHP
jgi:hypothetical protein